MNILKENQTSTDAVLWLEFRLEGDDYGMESSGMPSEEANEVKDEVCSRMGI